MPASGRSPIRVLLVDDHAMVRRGMRDFLDLHADLEVVGEAINGVSALAATAELAPDVVVMDLLMPGLDGVAATAEIKRRHPAVEVVVASDLGMAERTARTHVSNILAKLRLETRTQAALDAIEHHLAERM